MAFCKLSNILVLAAQVANTEKSTQHKTPQTPGFCQHLLPCEENQEDVPLN
jgi:hypothetical protein